MKLRATTSIVLTISLLAGAPPVLAQENGQTDAETTTVEVPSMREEIYKELGEAQLKADDKEYGEAIKILEKLSKKELNSYERAQTLNLFAYTYYSQERYPKAIETYESLLREDNLPDAMVPGTVFALAQLYFITEDWKNAVRSLDRWMTFSKEPDKRAWELKAQAHFELKEYRKSIEALTKVIELVKKDGKRVEERTYLLLRLLHHELGEYNQVLSVLKELIRYYPKEQYWLHLAATYSELKDEKRQLNTLELAYVQGYLDTETELISLGGLLLQNDLPYKAGVLIEKGLNDGVISSTAQHWKLLSQAWTLAHENERAIPALRRAAELAGDGKQYVLLAQTYLNLDKWSEAADAARTALRKGSLDRVDQVQLLLGQALFELGSFDEARAAFLAARNDARSSRVAGQWLTYIENERDRRAKLKAALQ